MLFSNLPFEAGTSVNITMALLSPEGSACLYSKTSVPFKRDGVCFDISEARHVCHIFNYSYDLCNAYNLEVYMEGNNTGI